MADRESTDLKESIPEATKFYWHQRVEGNKRTPDKPVPWFQGTLVINKRNTPSYVGDYNGLSSLKPWLSGELGA